MRSKHRSIEEQLDAFFDERQVVPNMYLTDDKISVYVRHGYHCFHSDVLTSCFDIANVTVEHRYRKQGVFKHFLEESLARCPWEVVYVENVVNSFLADYLDRCGFTHHSYSTSGPPSFYKSTLANSATNEPKSNH